VSAAAGKVITKKRALRVLHLIIARRGRLCERSPIASTCKSTPMKITPLLALLCLTALAYAETPEKLLEQLREEVRTELRSSLDKENDANNERLVRLEGILIEEIPERDLTSGKLSRTLGGLLKLRTFTKSKKAEDIVGEL